MGKELTIKDYKQCVENMSSEILALKRKIGGLQTSNENYRKQVVELKKRIEHYKALGIEGDQLYEGKIAELDKFRKGHKEEFEAYKKQRDNELSNVVKGHERAMDEKRRVIDGLSGQANKLIQQKNKLESENAAYVGRIKELETIIEESSKPWWKKIF